VAPEAQVYPMSSYSYFLIPTGANDKRMDSKKRQTLADFLFYSVCTGQKEMGPIGYSPLPSNLVKASFAQTALLGAVDSKVDVSREKSAQLAACDNPTFVAGNLNVNHLAVIAPKPPACAKQHAGPCADVSTGSAGAPGAVGPTTPGGGSNPGSTNPGGTNPGGTNNPGGTVGPGGVVLPGSNNGVPGGTNQTGGQNTGDGTFSANGQPQAINVGDYRSPNLTGVLSGLAVIEILVVLIVPPAVYFFVLQRRKAGGT